MTLNSAGLLSGTPTVAGTFSLLVNVTDSAANPPVAANYTVTVTPPTVIVTTSGIIPLVQGVASPSITLTATGGKKPYTWSATSLPPGMTLSSAGVLSGTPITSNSYVPTFTATDSSNPGVTSAAAAIMINVLLSGMTITTPALHDGVANVSYGSTTLQQQGGAAPITWSAVGLPAGMTFTAAGILSGTPSLAGIGPTTITITITAVDSRTPPQIATYMYPVNIAAPVNISTAALPGGSQSVTYPAFLMQANGGTPPYTWTASGLPLGTTLTSAGILSGVPTVPFFLPLPDGAVALGAVYVADNTYRVEINGQAAVTSYAGASQGSVAGLTQINAIVPPTAPTGAAIPLVVYIGKANSARASQLSVTMAVQ
jgi:hypothetical protein